MDFSNGYDTIASQYIAARTRSKIGVARIAEWVGTLDARSKVLDIGCGNGIPVTRELLAAGHSPYAIDASSTMIQTFKQEFPHVPARCEAAEHSDFFNEQFDAVVAIGLIFLLEEATQTGLLRRIGNVLRPHGRLLFSAPLETGRWQDVMTGQESLSLGEKQYLYALEANGLQLVNCFADEGGNNYYSAIKTVS